MKHVVSKDLVGSGCADGAPTMLGKNSGFVSYVKKKKKAGTFCYTVTHL